MAVGQSAELIAVIFEGIFSPTVLSGFSFHVDHCLLWADRCSIIPQWHDQIYNGIQLSPHYSVKMITC